MPGAADSWYHEKESAWLYGVVAAAEPDPSRRELFLKLAAAAEEKAACWWRTAPSISPHFAPALSLLTRHSALRGALGRLLGASVG